MSDIKAIQKEILGILNAVVQICDDNNIDYFLVSGTALGAVRHEGFIPWDDDLDIGMTRENYNKFVTVAHKLKDYDMFFQDYNSDPSIPFYFSKVRLNGTTFKENYTQHLKMHHGLYIDIFQYDNVPDDPKLRKRQRLLTTLWMNLFISKTLTGTSTPQTTIKGKIKKFIRGIGHVIMIPVKKDYLFKKIDKNAQKYNNIKTTHMNYVKEPTMIMETIDLLNLEKIKFEDQFYSINKNVEKYLEIQYGNYLQLPPEESRVGHRPVEVKLKQIIKL